MIKLYTLEQPQEWDQIVRSFASYDVYWLSGYVKAFWMHGDGEPLLFFYENYGVRAINVVMKRDVSEDDHFSGKIPKGRYFDFSTPYGYGGWLVENPCGEDVTQLFEEYNEYCIEHDIVSEFVRFHPLIRNFRYVGNHYETKFLGETVAMDLSSPEIILSNLKKENRKKIRKADKHGVEVFWGCDKTHCREFQRLYRETMKRNNASSYYYFEQKFFEYIYCGLPDYTQLFYAVNDAGEMISANLVLMANGMINGFLLGSNRKYKELSPDNILLYKIALWGYRNGYKWFHMGGGRESSDDSLLNFKKSFYQGELHKFYIGKKIFNDMKYKKLTEIRNNVITRYFPAYRGEACEDDRE